MKQLDRQYQMALEYRREIEESLESSQNLIEVLSRAASLQATVDILRETKIGVVVNKLRSHKDQAVSSLATRLVSGWREQLASPSDTASNCVDKNQMSSSSPPVSMHSSDPTRDKCIQMILLALESVVAHKGDNLESVATSIEQELFDQAGNTGNAYKALFRSKFLNLKSNRELGKSLVGGFLSPRRFVEMTSIEMASEERKAEDAVMEQENLNRAHAARDNVAETSEFVCGKCRERKTKYFQLQTRSADEPMTTYVTCLNCNNRWKF